MRTPTTTITIPPIFPHCDANSPLSFFLFPFSFLFISLSFQLLLVSLSPFSFFLVHEYILPSTTRNRKR